MIAGGITVGAAATGIGGAPVAVVTGPIALGAGALATAGQGFAAVDTCVNGTGKGSCGAAVAKLGVDVALHRVRLPTGTRNASQAAPRTSPWTLGPSPRGFAIEEALGANLPRSFPTIDRFASGTATSIKSIDLTAASYQSTSRPSSRLTGYVESAARFNGASFGGRTITSGSITGRELVIAVQSGATNASQQGVLNQIVQYGASNGVVVRVVPVP